jgi:HlyD family secretion protein
MRRALIILLIVGIVAGASWFGYQQFGGAKAAASPDYQVVTVARGDITATVSATGTVLAERQANVAFQSSGTVVRVAVKVGDTVKAGELIAQLDTKDLELAVKQAQLGLRTAEAQLAQLRAGPNASDLAAAQAALASAQAAYQQLLQGADADQQAAARAAVEQARVALSQAQQSYDRIKDLPNSGMMPQALQLQQATINYETAQAQFRVTTRGANQAQIAASQAQVAQAQSALDRLLRGASKEQIEIAEAAAEQARLNVEQAQRRVDNARLTAPWEGVVTVVNLVEGALAQPAAPAIQLADQSVLHINVQVDEVDIAGLAVGQPVQIELDALPDQRLQGRVTSIAPAATLDATGIISYLVRIDFIQTNASARPGMSATAAITSNTRAAVVLVPNRAVTFDRATGQTFVEKQAGAGTQRVEVRLGLRDEQQSEVREGLAEGDQVVIRKVAGFAERIQQSFGGF